MRKCIIWMLWILALVVMVAAVVGFWFVVSYGSGDEVKTWAEAIKNYVEATAVAVGGGWALWRFWLRRERETVLQIDPEYKTVPLGTNHLVFFDVKLTNKGSVHLEAEPARWSDKSEDEEGAYEDVQEKLKYSGDLLLRRLPQDLIAGDKLVWFQDASDESPHPDDFEADLLDGYVSDDGKTEFWMEPSEEYHGCTSFVLERGLYLGMVTFLGKRVGEFWRQLFLVEVPKRTPAGCDKQGQSPKVDEPPHAHAYVRLQKSNVHGIGVVAIRDIPNGTEVFPDDNGEVVWRKAEELKLAELPDGVRRLYEDFCIIKDKGRLYGCPKNFNLMTAAWYLNHSKTPNVRCDEDYRFFASKDIAAGTELTADYETYNEFGEKPPYIT